MAHITLDEWANRTGQSSLGTISTMHIGHKFLLWQSLPITT
jgi:hypothetical protein